MKQFKDYREYRKDVFERVGTFNSTFIPWTKWANVSLTELNPCKFCDISKKLNGNDRYYHMLTCKHCSDNIKWQMECLDKLAWYEKNDERLKGEENDEH